MTRTLLAGLTLIGGLAALLLPLYGPDIGIVGHALSGAVGTSLVLIGVRHV